MSEENLDVANEFAELTGTEIEIAPEAAPDDNGSDMTLENNVIDLTGSEEAQEVEQEAPMEMPENEDSPQEIIESSLNSDSHEEEYEQESENQEDDSYSSYDSTLDMLNETYGTEYEDLDELLDELEGDDKSNFASEQLEEMNRFVKETGRSAEDYFNTQSQDYDEMSDGDVIKEYLALENPELSGEEIDLFYTSTYKQNEEKFSSEENQFGKIHLKRDVSKARGELQELQEEYWSPEESSDNYTNEEIQQIEAQEHEAKEDFYDKMDDELDSIESLTFQINENESFDYQLTQEDKQVVGESLSNLDDFFEPYTDEQGNIDKESLALDMMAMKLQSKIVKSVASQYRSKGSEQVLRDIKNPSFEPAKVTDSKGGNSIGDLIGKQIFGDSTLWD